MLEQTPDYPGISGAVKPGERLLVGALQRAEPPLAAAILAHTHKRGAEAAVNCGDQSLSWAELGQRSAAVAAYLRGQGVGPGDRVLLMSPRMADVVTCILGIWRAGAAYVPVNAQTPPARLASIVASVAPAHALLGSLDLAVDVPRTIFDAGVIDRWSETTEPGIADAVTGADDEAYVIFTSGSTGVPLGVPILHRQLAASTAARAHHYDYAPERFLLLSDIGFDSSIVGLFWTLAAGGCVVIPTEEERAQLDVLTDRMARGDISHCLCVPTLYGGILKQLERRGKPVHWPAQMIMAGDHCPTRVIERHFASVPANCGLSNEFGPTEATVWASVTHYREGLEDPSVGGPVSGVWLAVLDEAGAPVAPGEPGELAVGGPNITRGYINGQAEHENRFGHLPAQYDPFGDGQRRYFRTGDGAVIRNGALVLLGRADTQMNIHGARVDAAEIERAACAAGRLNNAVATAIDARPLANILQSAGPSAVAMATRLANNSDHPEIVLRRELATQSPEAQELALIVESETAPDFPAILAGIARQVGDAKRPTRVAWLQVFPTTQNGKIDRTATIALAQTMLVDGMATAAPAPEPAAAGIAPEPGQPDMPGRGELTGIILASFRRELRKAGLTETQSFFDHGGHSLKALNVVLEIEAATDMQVSTALLYQHPTADGLARALTGEEPAGAEAPVEAAPGKIEPAPTDATQQTALVAIGDKMIEARPLPVAGGFRTLTIPLRATGSKPPVIAIHNIGDNASYFSELADALDDDQPFYCLGKPIKYSMIQRFDEMLEGEMNVEDIARVYADEIERIVPEGPIFITSLCGGVPFGHSTALELTRRGRQPALNLMFADWHAPNLKLSDESVARQIWKNRWNQIKRERWNLLWTFHKRAPASLLLRAKLLEREAERLMLRWAEKRGKPLSTRLSYRKSAEESLEQLHAFEHLPYAGPSFSIRGSKDPNFWLDGKEQGWTGVLDDWAHEKVDGLGFDIVHGKGAHASAAIVTRMIDRVLAGQHPFAADETEDRAQVAAAPGDPENGRYDIQTPEYTASLALQRPDALRTPRADQRNWLLNRTVQEMSEEVDDLIRRAPTMIGGGGMVQMSGRTDAELAPDDIMEDWQFPLMQAMADGVAGQGGDILEVGYGRGVSAAMVQEHNPTSHWIIECNQHVIADCERWKAKLPDRDIRVIEGLWQDRVQGLGPFDGILFHTYPLSLEELAESISNNCTFAENFFEHAARMLKPGGRFTYFSNERDSLSRRHQRSLLTHFDSFTISRVDNLNIPETSRDAHWFQEIVCVTARAKQD